MLRLPFLVALVLVAGTSAFSPGPTIGLAPRHATAKRVIGAASPRPGAGGSRAAPLPPPVWGYSITYTTHLLSRRDPSPRCTPKSPNRHLSCPPFFCSLSMHPCLSLRMHSEPSKQASLPNLPSLPASAKGAALGFLLAVSLTLGCPQDAFAAKSGGRVGGGSFSRVQTQSRRYAPPVSAGASAYGSTTTIVAPRPYIGGGIGIMPYYYPSPYGYGATMMIGPSIGNIILLGGIAFVGYKIITSNQEQDQFGGVNEEINVCKIQVATYCDNRGPSSVLGIVSRLADKVNTEDQDSLSSLVSDVALALLRKESDWISAKIESFKVDSEDEAEEKFSQLSLKERAKIERETVNRVRGVDKSDKREGEAKLEDIGKPTAAVITLILALEGRKIKECNDLASLRSALSAVGSDVAGNDSLMAAEVMWTPEEAWETVTPDEIVLDYPDHIPL